MLGVFLDLQRQLTCRRDDQCTRRPGFLAVGGFLFQEVRQNRNQESGGLAGPRLRLADHIAA